MAAGDVFPSELVAGFRNAFEGNDCDFISRASGRAELIGGHTDYNEGYVIAAAVDSSYWVAARGRKDKVVRLYSEWAGQMHEFDLSERIEPSRLQKWANYGRGVAAVLLENDYPLRGADLFGASSPSAGHSRGRARFQNQSPGSVWHSSGWAAFAHGAAQGWP